MKKRVFLALFILCSFCQNTFAQFNSNDGEYELYVKSVSETPSVIIIHFMGNIAVACEQTQGTNSPTVSSVGLTNRLKSDSRCLDKWINGVNGTYYWTTLTYDSSKSSYSTTVYKTQRQYSRVGGQYFTGYLYFDNDHKTCKYHYCDEIYTFVRTDVDEFLPIEYRLRKKNNNDEIIYK